MTRAEKQPLVCQNERGHMLTLTRAVKVAMKETKVKS